MPAIVTAIEDAIDAAADDASWIKGDKNTVSKLEAAHWNFDSKEAGRALSMLIANCKTDLARQFLTGGAPVNAKGYGWFGGSTPGAAAHCSDPALVRMLIAKGALKNPADKKGFLLSSADSGNPDMVAIALKYFHNTKIRDSDGKPLLSIAAGATSRSDDEEVEASFNSAKVISMLVAAGADVNARDADGNTPLVEAESDEVARVLIKAGANPNARNSDGRTPLFDHYFAEPKKALIEAGADVTIRDKYGATALFNQEDVEAVSAMIAAGADVNATSLNGYTALEDALSEKVAIALINAGAKLPTDPDRLNKLTMRAIRGKWNELLPYLQKAGGAPKAQ
jgi:ankyrin repeat protein